MSSEGAVIVVAQLVAGVAALVVGAEVLVRGAAGLAARLGISPLVIGLTVVAIGTSSPELAVTAAAAVTGAGDLAVGNVVGSNIFNVLFILGLSAAITPLLVARQLLRFDVPVMLVASLLLVATAWNGRVARWEGAILLALAVVYTVVLVRTGRRDGAHGGLTAPAGRLDAPSVQALMVAGGLVLLVLGSRWLLKAAVAIAGALGLSELIIGLTVVAAGTSLPEVAASVVAGLRGQRDIAVGNVVGSSIFNILGVLGIGAVAAPSGLAVAPAALRFDIPVMIAVALACVPVFLTQRLISRAEGWLLLSYYLAYTLFLVLDAQGHDAARLFGRAMLAFVLPITAIGLAALAVRSLRRDRARA